MRIQAITAYVHDMSRTRRPVPVTAVVATPTAITPEAVRRSLPTGRGMIVDVIC